MKSIVIIFGRFNPMTTGHEKLLETGKHISESTNSDYVIFPSRSHDNVKNPLPFSTKMRFMKKSFPEYRHNIFDTEEHGIRNAFDIFEWVYSHGYNEMYYVVGSDRVTEFTKIGGIFSRDNDMKVNVVSAGDRDPDADDVSGMSASKMREYVRNGDFNSFESGTPKGLNSKESRKLFNLLRIQMDEDTGKNLDSIIFESLSRSERLKRGRTMKRIAGKLAAKRKLAMKKRSTPEKIQNKSRKMAINALKKKFARGKNFNELPDAQKQAIEKKIEKKKGLIDRLSKKMKKVVRSKESERLSGNKE